MSTSLECRLLRISAPPPSLKNQNQMNALGYHSSKYGTLIILDFGEITLILVDIHS